MVIPSEPTVSWAQDEKVTKNKEAISRILFIGFMVLADNMKPNFPATNPWHGSIATFSKQVGRKKIDFQKNISSKKILHVKIRFGTE